MKVITLPSVPSHVLAAVEDVLTAAQVNYHVEDQDPTVNAPGAFRRTDPSTSKRAAGEQFPRSGSQRYRVLMAIINAGWQGATATQIEEKTGIPFRSLTPRIGELKRGGWVKAAGFTRTGSMGAQQEAVIVTQKALDWKREHDA